MRYISVAAMVHHFMKDFLCQPISELNIKQAPKILLEEQSRPSIAKMAGKKDQIDTIENKNI